MLENKFAEKFNMSTIHCYSSWVEQGFSNHEVAGSNLIWWIRLIFLLRNEYFVYYLFFLLYVYYLCELTYSDFAYHWDLVVLRQVTNGHLGSLSQSQFGP